MPLTLTTPPVALPLTTAEVKFHSRISHDEEDSLIDGLIGAAVDYLDGPTGILGRAIMQQEWLLELSEWPDRLTLPVEPVSAVSVSYYDSAGAEVSLSDGVYRLDQYPGMAGVVIKEDGQTLPGLDPDRAYPVRVSMTAGYADADAVPDGLKILISQLVAHWYENREAVVVGAITASVPLAFSMMLARYRVKL